MDDPIIDEKLIKVVRINSTLQTLKESFQTMKLMSDYEDDAVRREELLDRMDGVSVQMGVEYQKLEGLLK